MHAARPLILFAAIACGSTYAANEQTIDMSRLSDSQIALADVSKPDRAGKAFLAATLINAPMQKICAVIQDFPAYPDFMPNMDKTKVTQAASDYSLVDMTLKLPLGKIKKYRLKMQPASSPQSCQLSWKLVPWEGLKQEETIVDTSGYWQLSPAPSNPNQTVVKYFVYTDPGPVPTGLGWIVDSMSKDSIPKTLEALRNKVAPR